MYVEPELFDRDYGIDHGPIDGTQIKSTLLYFSAEEHSEFRKEAKIAMKTIWGQKAQEEGNLSDLTLALLKKFNNGEIKLEKKDIYRQGNLFEDQIP